MTMLSVAVMLHVLIKSLSFTQHFSALVRSMWAHENLSEEDSYTTDVDSGSAQALWTVQDSSKNRDPEHFPPRNRTQRLGNVIRLIPKYFRGEQSQFGLRVAAATMTIAILCYLRDTQSFFLRQRLRWVCSCTLSFRMYNLTNYRRR